MNREKYQELAHLLDNITKAAGAAKRECEKKSPNATKVCKMAYENLDSLLFKIETIIFSDGSDLTN